MKRIKKYERETGETVTIDRYSEFSREHSGRCYRNSNINPASAEEPQSEMLARDFLLGENGEYRGDDLAIFSKEVVTDNDTIRQALLEKLRLERVITLQIHPTYSNASVTSSTPREVKMHPYVEVTICSQISK